jgi:hypothetical protein
LFINFKTSFLYSEFQVNWYLAKLECRYKGMELVSIESREEQEALVIGLGAHFSLFVFINVSFWHIFATKKSSNTFL